MIQNIYPHIYHNEYKPKEAGPDDTVFAFSAGRLLCRLADPDSGEIACPTAALFRKKDLQYLFRIDDRAYYLYQGEEVPESEGYEYLTSRLLRKHNPKYLAFAGMTAWHLNHWYRNNRFCGKCGARTGPGTEERVLCCPDCGNMIYPTIAPAVIVGVISGDRILITRYRGRPYSGNALVAGFCEIGESVEDTVRREVMEETGLCVKNLHYYKSQPWGFADNLLMGYYCEADGSDQVILDDQELSEGIWYGQHEIGCEDADLSLTADMIMNFKEKGRAVLYSSDLLCAADGEGPDYSWQRRPDQAENEASKKESLTRKIRKIWENHIPGLSTRKKGESAVVIPLIYKEGDWHILFEKRASSLQVQPGEICFPGGRMEAGESPRQTAIRETAEELLIEESQIEILAALDPVMGPNGASLWPFAAVIHHYENSWSEDEVESIFTLPFSELESREPECYYTELATVTGEDFPYEMIPGGRNYAWRKKRNPIYFYRDQPEIIWGVTARILYEFLRKYKKECIVLP